MELNGLPLHPLVVHAAVVFTPLAAIAAILYVVPRWRATMRWPMLVLALVAVGSIVVAYYTGKSFFNSRPPEIQASPQVLTHQHRGRQLFYLSFAFGILAIAGAWVASRGGVLRVVIDVLLAVVAVVVLVQVVRVGDAGARAVWG